jgi:hypothetical protein
VFGDWPCLLADDRADNRGKGVRSSLTVGQTGASVWADVAPKAESLTPSYQEIDNKDNQKYAADAASHHWAAIVISSAPTKQEQQYDDDQDNVHVSSVICAWAEQYGAGESSLARHPL